MTLGFPEIAIIVLIAIILIAGPKKLPELMRSIGRSTGEIKKGKKEIEKEIKEIDKK